MWLWDDPMVGSLDCCILYGIIDKIKQFEDTKEVIRRRKSKDRQYNGQKIPKW